MRAAQLVIALVVAGTGACPAQPVLERLDRIEKQLQSQQIDEAIRERAEQERRRRELIDWFRNHDPPRAAEERPCFLDPRTGVCSRP